MVEGDLAFFVRVADPFEGEAGVVVFDDAGETAEDAVEGSGACADLAVEVIVFVAAHAVDVMVVDHADEGGAGVEECGDDVEVRHFVDEDGVRLEGVEGVADGGGGVGG